MGKQEDMDNGKQLESAYATVSNSDDTEVYEAIELDQQRFSIWSTIGLQFSCSAAPLAVLSFTYLVAGVGGAPYFFWCYFVAIIGQLIVTASLAEIAAILPHASGQIFWAGSLAPPSMARFLSYLVGALTFFGWTLGVAGSAVFTGDMSVALGVVIETTYVSEHYQVFLIAAANIILGIIINTVSIRVLPGLTKFMVVFLNAMAIYIFVVLLAKAHPKASAQTAFINVINETGWTSDSFVFLLGFLPGLLTVCLPDSSAHMAEEIPDPERNVPLAMFATSVLNAIAGLIMVIALVFCIIAPENMLEPLAGIPIFQVAKDAWNNLGWIITVAIIMIIVPLNGVIAIMTGASRVLWAFSKHGGIPASKQIGYTNVKYLAPINAVLATGLLSTLLCLLVFGPSTVLSGIFGSSGICMAVSYAVPIFFMLLKDRKTLPENRYFNLGKFGRPLNFLAICWELLVIVMLCFPTYMPVTLDSMNWSSAVFVGLFVVALLNWFVVRRYYETPKPIVINAQTVH